jgi:hypothetical protein
MIKHQRFDSARLLAIKFSGASSAQENADQLLAFYKEYPPCANYDHILDMRRWSGMISDADLKYFLAAFENFRLTHGLSDQENPTSVYLVNKGLFADEPANQANLWTKRHITTVFSTREAAEKLGVAPSVLATLEKFLGP